jgi:hypothetical protein
VASPQRDTTAIEWTSIRPSVLCDADFRIRTGDPPDRSSGLPIYLLTASLRL